MKDLDVRTTGVSENRPGAPRPKAPRNLKFENWSAAVCDLGVDF